MGIVGNALDQLAWAVCSVDREHGKQQKHAPRLEQQSGETLLAGFDGDEHTTTTYIPTGTPPECCEECGGRYPLSKPPQFIVDMTQRWLCAGCCLQEDADANPFQFMKGNLEQVWISQARLFAMHGVRPEYQARRPLQPALQPVVVVLDMRDCDCQLVRNALDHAFGYSCVFADSGDLQAVQAALRKHPQVPLEDLCVPGRMSAVFPSGCWIGDCQRHPKVLLYELKYMRKVRPADPQRTLAVEREYHGPLQALRRELGSVPRWWLDQRALALISLCLECEKHAVVDGFLQEHEWRDIRAEAQHLDRRGQMEPGRRKGTSHLNEDEADLMNRDDRPFKWTMLDDNIAYCGDADGRAPSVGQFDTPARDALVNALKAGGDHVRSSVTARLARVDLREKAMVTVYRASTRGRYQQHVDSHDAKFRRLSTLLYFNDSWEQGDGGENRLFFEGALNTAVRADTAPVANRLLLFWADDDCPHEVLHTQKDRYASTVWYADADLLVGDMLVHPLGLPRQLAEDHMKIVGHLQTAFPVAPLSFAEAMVRAGVPLDEGRRLHAVHSLLAYERRLPYWVAWDNAKSALEGSDPRICELESDAGAM